MDYKVIKGKTRSTAEIDSTWSDLKKANDRRDTLRKSLRTKRISVWVVPLEEGDPLGYRKPRRGPWEGYNRPGPPTVK